MRSLIRRRAPVDMADPAPSRISYRAQRLWLTPLFRVGMPIGLIAGLIALYFSNEANRQAIVETAHEIRREVEGRPEFRINLLGIHGASPSLTEDIRVTLALDLPRSSFDTDLEALRARVEGLPAVASADVRIQSGGYLAVTVSERVPAAIWQTRAGPVLIDGDGMFIAAAADRPFDQGLPRVAGQGADQALPEALQLYASAAPLGDTLLGLVRMGERRWDVVMRDGRRILLPETGAVMALDRALALHDVTDILNRDIVRLDLRLPNRMSVQLGSDAVLELQRRGALETQLLTGDRRG